MIKLVFGFVLLLVGLLFLSVANADVTGTGSSFPTTVFNKWEQTFHARNDFTVKYVNANSGQGIKAIMNKTVDFGCTDAPLSQDELRKHDLMQFPVVMGAITFMINIPLVKQGELKLDGDTLASIYLGEITYWDDPRIVEMNPLVRLSHIPIHTFYRSDEAGSTFSVTNYFSKVNSRWKNEIGYGMSVKFRLGEGVTTNKDMTSLIKSTPGAIGYAQFSFAMKEKLDYIKIKNKDGIFISPSEFSVRASAAAINWVAENDFEQIMTNSPGKDSWPITAASYILLEKNPADPLRKSEVLKFFEWAMKRGEFIAMIDDYVVVPSEVSSKIFASWNNTSNKFSFNNPQAQGKIYE